MKGSKLTKGIVCLAAVALFSGCATRSTVPPSINIPPEYSQRMGDQLDATGFQQGIIDYNAIAKYNKVILDVQMSDQLVEPGAFDGLKTGYLMYSDDDVKNCILPYTKDSYSAAFSNGSQYFKLTDRPGANTLKVNVYITQIVINDAVIGAISNLSFPTVITKVIGMGLHNIAETGGGAIAEEIIITDSVTGNIVAVFDSREKGVFAIFNAEGFSMYSADKRIIDTWSKDLVSTLDQVKSGYKNLTAAQIAPLIVPIQL